MAQLLSLTRFREAKEYKAPGHRLMQCLRVQGMEAGPSTAMWMAISIISPKGGIDASRSPFEKFYMVLEGEIEIASGNEAHIMTKWDSCRLAPGAERTLRNTSSKPATVLLVMENAREAG